MKKKIVSISLIAFLFYSCEEVFFEDDISKVTIDLIAPVDNTVFDAQLINLNWIPIEGAEEYQLQIATPSFLNASQIVLDTILTKTTFEIELSPGEYQWRAKGINSAYNTNYSTNSFSIVTLNTNETVKLTSPENNLISNNLEQYLSWEKVNYANNYRLQLWKPNTSGEKVQDLLVKATDTIITFGEGAYIWQIRAENDNNSTLYASRSILIDATAPNISVLQSPTNGQVLNNTTVHFIWSRAAIDGSIEKSTVYVYTDAGLTNLVFSSEASENSLYKDMVLGTYYWYVKTADEAGNSSDKSEVFSFTIE